jgi:Spy/CpxP family protein refolding chaperone
MKTNALCLTLLLFVSMTLSVSATPLVCDPLTSCRSLETWQNIEEQDSQQRTHNMATEEQEILLDLMRSQAEDRYEIKKKARQALINIQRFAVSDGYDQYTAKELAMIYGKAMAELAYLDIQLAVRFRNILSEKQLKAMQDNIELHR